MEQGLGNVSPSIDTMKCGIRKRKKIRRGRKHQNFTEELDILYSNIQGVTGKNSLMEIMGEVDPDICLLAETMNANFKLDGCRVINPLKWVSGSKCCYCTEEKVKKSTSY